MRVPSLVLQFYGDQISEFAVNFVLWMKKGAFPNLLIVSEISQNESSALAQSLTTLGEMTMAQEKGTKGVEGVGVQKTLGKAQEMMTTVQV